MVLHDTRQGTRISGQSGPTGPIEDTSQGTIPIQEFLSLIECVRALSVPAWGPEEVGFDPLCLNGEPHLGALQKHDKNTMILNIFPESDFFKKVAHVHSESFAPVFTWG